MFIQAGAQHAIGTGSALPPSALGGRFSRLNHTARWIARPLDRIDLGCPRPPGLLLRSFRSMSHLIRTSGMTTVPHWE